MGGGSPVAKAMGDDSPPRGGGESGAPKRGNPWDSAVAEWMDLL